MSGNISLLYEELDVFTQVNLNKIVHIEEQI